MISLFYYCEICFYVELTTETERSCPFCDTGLKEIGYLEE